MNTTIKQIADYWINNSDICETELNFDWSDSHTHCWNCGDNKERSGGKVNLERCHIIPNALGGEDVPSNYVLLCKDCHTDAPNVKSSKYMWEWILSNKVKIGMYDNHRIEKALELFESRKGYSFFSVFENKKIPHDEFLTNIKEVFNGITNHFGKKINPNTYYSMLCELENKIS